ncbi:transcriptional regulator, GntR family [Cupriavidus sp. YR651]|uniref:GntR family transcriptional regulator n=1 Tax=Cupriavidus sp. YR651 TaxID=1855315 RepID=UPI000890B137|nr:GntR family transcriptional regulator [Cupriavidus sp. YR651]SDC24247.1 transcriptional regulator, GntR family [Cupriavidus sp. YR651]
MRIVQQALYLEVADRLRAMIDDRSLMPGAWIDEVALATSLGISRTPLREALKVLAAEGLVRLEPRRGCFVNALTEQDLDEIFPLMALLEGRCAYEAARNVTQADLDALEGLHAELARYAQAGDIDAYYETNYQIHEAIQRLAGNRWLSGVVSDLRKVLRLSRHKSLKLQGRIHESCAEHMSVFSALKAHDPEGAEVSMKTHVLRQRGALRALDQADPAPVPVPAAVHDAPTIRSRLRLAGEG